MFNVIFAVRTFHESLHLYELSNKFLTGSDPHCTFCELIFRNALFALCGVAREVQGVQPPRSTKKNFVGIFVGDEAKWG